jgi:hypothetical protein
MTMALLTVADVMKWLPQAQGREDKISDAIAVAQGFAEDFCKRRVELAEYDIVLNVAPGTVSIHLPDWPLVVDDTHELQVWENPDTAGRLVSSSSYTVVAEDALLERTDGGEWAWGYRALRVKYWAGYTAATLPVGLRGALLRLVAWVLEHLANVGAKQEASDGYSATYEDVVDGVPQSVAAALNAYKKVTLLG